MSKRAKATNTSGGRAGIDPARLIRWRESLSLDQGELARRAGISQQLYSLIETGRRTDPKLSTALAIAAALGCRVEDITVKVGAEGFEPTT